MEDNKISDYDGTNHKIRYAWEQVKALSGQITENENKIISLQDELNNLKKKSVLSHIFKQVINEEIGFTPALPIGVASLNLTSTIIDTDKPYTIYVPEVRLGQVFRNNSVLIQNSGRPNANFQAPFEFRNVPPLFIYPYCTVPVYPAGAVNAQLHTANPPLKRIGHAIGWQQYRYFFEGLHTFQFEFWISQDDNFFTGQQITAEIIIWAVSYDIGK